MWIWLHNCKFIATNDSRTNFALQGRIHVWSESAPAPSGIATGWQGGQSATPDSEKMPKVGEDQEKIGENSGKIGKKEEKLGRKGKNRDVSFTLPLLTSRAGYATASPPPLWQINHANSAYLRLFWAILGLYQPPAPPPPPFGSRPPLFTYPGSAPALDVETLVDKGLFPGR